MIHGGDIEDEGGDGVENNADDGVANHAVDGTGNQEEDAGAEEPVRRAARPIAPPPGALRNTSP
jgi:hypothetical protein